MKKKPYLVLLFVIVFSKFISQNNYIVDTSNYADLRGKIKNQNFFIKMDPNNVDAILRRGVYKLQIRDFNGTIEDNLEVIRIAGDKSDAYNNIAMAQIGLRDSINAFKNFKKAIELEPKAAMGYLNLAHCKAEFHDYKVQ